jgi:hypothetical protein
VRVEVCRARVAKFMELSPPCNVLTFDSTCPIEAANLTQQRLRPRAMHFLGDSIAGQLFAAAKCSMGEDTGGVASEVRDSCIHNATKAPDPEEQIPWFLDCMGLAYRHVEDARQNVRLHFGWLPVISTSLRYAAEGDSSSKVGTREYW